MDTFDKKTQKILEMLNTLIESKQIKKEVLYGAKETNRQAETSFGTVN